MAYEGMGGEGQYTLGNMAGSSPRAFLNRAGD